MIFGVDCGKNKVHIVGDGVAQSFVKPPGTDRAKALYELRTEIAMWLSGISVPNEDAGLPRLYVEAPVVAGARNIQATIGIAETVGMVLSMGFPATLVPISTWKKTVVGKGNATKEDVAQWYQSTGGKLTGQDYYDASAIYCYGVRDMDIAERVRGGLLSQSEG